MNKPRSKQNTKRHGRIACKRIAQLASGVMRSARDGAALLASCITPSPQTREDGAMASTPASMRPVRGCGVPLGCIMHRGGIGSAARQQCDAPFHALR